MLPALGSDVARRTSASGSAAPKRPSGRESTAPSRLTHGCTTRRSRPIQISGSLCAAYFAEKRATPTKV